MKFRGHTPAEHDEIKQLVTAVFTASEGAEEGSAVGQLASDLILSTPADDLFGFVAVSDKGLAGAILFSRLSVTSGTNIFILSPVAVATAQQGKGTGQQLIRYGLNQIKQQGVQTAVTYGDPAFYSRVGFAPLSPDVLAPPFPLSQPAGWLGRSLTDTPLQAEPGICMCVAALNDPAYW